MTGKRSFESPILWSMMGEACRFWGPTYNRELWRAFGYQPDETTAFVGLHIDVPVRLIRDWVSENTPHYEITGLFHITLEHPHPFAACFKFPNFDDKLLFALRWL
jgi:hypothetical protein